MSAFAPRLSLMVLALVACGEEPEPIFDPPTRGTDRPTVSVRFEYRAPTVVSDETRARHSTCARNVGGTHIHLGWRDFFLVSLRIEGPELWARTFDDVPAGTTQRIRVNDVNVCEENQFGAVTGPRVYANGVLLTRQAETPGSLGMTEPGFSFRVDEDGVVRP